MSSTKNHKGASKVAGTLTSLQNRWQFAAALLAVAAAVAIALVFSGSSPSDKPHGPPSEAQPSAPAAETRADPPLDRALYPTEVHMWAAQCTAPGNLPPYRSWPRRPVSTAAAPFTVFAELDKMQQLKQRSPASSSSGTVEWLVAALNKIRADADPVHLRLLLWQLVAHADKQAHRNCFAKVAVDTGLVADVNAAMSDQSVPFSYTLLYLTVYAQLADPVLAQMLVRSAGASPVAPRVNGDTPIQHALYWQERAYQTLHGASCAGHNFRVGESAAAMLSAVSPQELRGAINKDGESIVLAGVVSRSKLFFRALKRVLLGYQDAEFVRQLVNQRGLGGRTPLIAAANPHSLIILVSKIFTRHGNVGVLDSTKGCQLDQLRELELLFPANVSTGGILVVPFGADALDNAAPNPSTAASADTEESGENADGPSPAIYRVAGVRSAVHDWSVEFVDALIELGADVNLQDDGASTPLHAAAHAGNVPVIKRLLQAGATPRADKEGRTPADVAAARGFRRAVAELATVGDKGAREELCFPRHCPQLNAHRKPAAPVRDENGWRIGVALGESDRCDLVEAGNMTLAEFKNSFWKLEQPVIVRGAVAAHALKDFARDRIVDEFGAIPLQAADTVTGQRSRSYEISLADYLESAQHDESQHAQAPIRATIVEVRNSNPLLREVSEFVRKTVPLVTYPETIFQSSTPWTLSNYQLNIGTERSCTAVHFHEVAVNVVLGGRKRWLLFPPSHSFYSTAHALDWTRQVPRRLRASQRALECVQNAGDAIFVPSGWGHGVLYEGETLGIGVLYTGGIVNSN